MRCYQHVGLTKEAQEFLAKNVKMVPSTVCPKCGEVISEKMDFRVYAREDVFHGDGPSLHEYNLESGGEVKEIVQAMPWSSGPVGFLCLETEGKRMFEWSEKSIEDC